MNITKPASTNFPPTQQAAYNRLLQEKTIDWSNTSATEAKALNALVKKGYAEKTSANPIQYKIKALTN